MAAIPLTEGNRNLAQAINKRINADGVMLAAKASVWRFGAIGLMVMLVEIGVACGLFGYSYINDDQALADRMAKSFAAALEKTKITGSVEMMPGQQIEMKPGQQLELKPGQQVIVTPGGMVEIKPGGTVEIRGHLPAGPVAGTVQPGPPINNSITIQPGPGGIPAVTGSIPGASSEMMRPTPQQLTGDNPSVSATRAVTNFTIFKYVPFEGGQVVTGWKFSSNEQSTPENQYCYYTTDASDVSKSVQITQGSPAANQCVWYNGQPPQAALLPATPDANKAAYHSELCGENVGYTISWAELPPAEKEFLGAWAGSWNNTNICGSLVVTQIFADGGVKAEYYYKTAGATIQRKTLTGLLYAGGTISLTDDQNGKVEFKRVGDTLDVQFQDRAGRFQGIFNRVALIRS